jgi:hypothetical protein
MTSIMTNSPEEMRPALEIVASRRETAQDIKVDVPLVTQAWRILREDYRRQAAERKTHEEARQHTRALLGELGDLVFRLRRTLPAITLEPQTGAQAAAALVDRLDEILRRAGVVVVAPQGEPYTAEHMELLDSVSQRPSPDVSEPVVHEVITPAILVGGALVQTGKVVVLVTMATMATTEETAATAESSGEAHHEPV